jgi:hypothetical protein
MASMSDSPALQRRDLRAVAIAGLRRASLWQWIFVLALAWYVWHFTNTTIRMHHGPGTSAYDFALYDQGTWLLSRFEAPFVTLMGRNLFGDHTSFIVLFVVPFYWFFPGPGTLLFLQSLALAAGAIPVFLYARRRLGSDLLALILGCAFLLHPALGGPTSSSSTLTPSFRRWSGSPSTSRSPSDGAPTPYSWSWPSS